MAVKQVLSNGVAPVGTSVGDIVQTAGGNYLVVEPGTPGSTYNPASGLYSVKQSDYLYFPESNIEEALPGVAQSAMSVFDKMVEQARENSAKSQAFAENQMAWQEEQNAKAMQFNAEQAQINRDWQERMSNTSYQRATSDLINAGLNPVLAVQNSGASTPSGGVASGVTSAGASGSVDTSATASLGSLFASLLTANTQLKETAMNNQTALQTAAINARAQESVAAMYTAMQYALESEFPSTFAALFDRLLGGNGSSGTSQYRNLLLQSRDVYKETPSMLGIVNKVKEALNKSSAYNGMSSARKTSVSSALKKN